MLKNMKKLIISLIVIVLIIGGANVVFATNEQKSAFDGLDLPEEGTTNIKEGEKTDNIPEGTVNKNDTNNNENTTEQLPEKTPYTGIGDYTGIVFIVVFGISAVYAYKKVKEYNA